MTTSSLGAYFVLPTAIIQLTLRGTGEEVTNNWQFPWARTRLHAHHSSDTALHRGPSQHP